MRRPITSLKANTMNSLEEHTLTSKNICKHHTYCITSSAPFLQTSQLTREPLTPHSTTIKNGTVHYLVITYHRLIYHPPHGVAVSDDSIVAMLRIAVVMKFSPCVMKFLHAAARKSGLRFMGATEKPQKC